MKDLGLTLLILISSFAWASAQVGEVAPDFILKGADGKPYHLADFVGKSIVVLEWFNNGCPYVRKHYESKNMQRLQAEYKAKGVTWFTISTSAKGKEGHLEESKAAQVVKDRKIASTALLLDLDQKVGRAYGAKTTPHLFVINKKGLVAYNGAIDGDNSARPITIAKYTSPDGPKKYFEDALNAVRADLKVEVPVMEPYGCSVKY
jgi:peroxiredoxin